ncbi:ABC transporter ATP-binding protein, partial [bacterium]
DYALLNWVILGGLGVYLLHAVLRYYEQRLVTTFSMDLVTEIRRDLFRYQMRLPLTYFENNAAGKLVSKLTYSIMMIKVLVETFAYVCLRESVTILLLIVAATVIDWRLTLILSALTPFVVLYIRRLNRYMAEVASQLQTKNDQILKILDRAYHSAKLFQIFGGGMREGDRFEEVLNQDKKFRIERTMVYAGNAILIGFLASAVLLASLWYGGRQIIQGQLSHGEVLAYMICLALLFRPLSQFVRATAYLQAGLIGIRSVFSIFENTTPIAEPEHPVLPERREGKVEFRGVWFQYARGIGGLRNVSFRAEPGQKVLIVGQSGAGKSTLLNLLMRLYDGNRGSILIDGVNIRKMRLDDLRAYFSVVAQDQLHVEDTILGNVFFGEMGNKGPDMEAQLEKALDLGRQMELNRFIASLERKFGQKVGAEGLGYSRGELQKLALMRAAAKDAPIVLMDEPTASLDHRSERGVLKIIAEHFRKKTVLIISHRPLPQLRPDWVVVLKKGAVEAQGRHEDLIARSPYYRELLAQGREEPIPAPVV